MDVQCARHFQTHAQNVLDYILECPTEVVTTWSITLKAVDTIGNYSKKKTLLGND